MTRIRGKPRAAPLLPKAHAVRQQKTSSPAESALTPVPTMSILESALERKGRGLRSRHRRGAGAAVKGGAQEDPEGQGDPFGDGEVPGEDGEKLHEHERKGGEGTQGGDQPETGAGLDEPEGDASGEPAKGGGGGSHFGDGDKGCVAEEQSRRGTGADHQHGGVRSLEARVNAAELLRDRAIAAEGEEQAGRGHEVAVETLEQPEHGDGQNKLNGPARAEGLLEGDGGGEALAEEALPRCDVGDRGDGEGVKKCANSQSQGNGIHVAPGAQVWVGLLGVLGDGLEAGQEEGHDLQGKQDGSQRGAAKRRMKIGGSAVGSADAG